MLDEIAVKIIVDRCPALVEEPSFHEYLKSYWGLENFNNWKSGKPAFLTLKFTERRLLIHFISILQKRWRG